MTEEPQQPDFVIVVDDDRTTRQQIIALLASDRIRMRPFVSLLAFLEWLDYERLPENTVIAAEITLPDLGGFDLLNILRADGVFVPTILMGTAMSVSNAVDAMHAGASYILQKPFPDSTFRAAMLRAAQRRSLLPTTPAEPIRRKLSSLSERQFELLIHVSKGRTNREIAGRLSISEKTVELHRAAMMQKMGAGSLAELIRIAVECGDLLQPAAHA